MPSSDPLNFDETDVEQDPITGRYHLTFDPEQISRPSMVVVYFVAHVNDTSPFSLPQIQSTIDTDSLDRWLAEAQNHSNDSEISFSYAEYQITLDTFGNIWAEPVDDSEGSLSGGGPDPPP